LLGAAVVAVVGIHAKGEKSSYKTIFICKSLHVSPKGICTAFHIDFLTSYDMS
jgi:hypothetical protein